VWGLEELGDGGERCHDDHDPVQVGHQAQQLVQGLEANLPQTEIKKYQKYSSIYVYLNKVQEGQRKHKIPQKEIQYTSKLQRAG
jgi:hypothetical protein